MYLVESWKKTCIFSEDVRLGLHNNIYNIYFNYKFLGVGSFLKLKNTFMVLLCPWSIEKTSKFFQIFWKKQKTVLYNLYQMRHWWKMSNPWVVLHYRNKLRDREGGEEPLDSPWIPCCRPLRGSPWESLAAPSRCQAACPDKIKKVLKIIFI